MFYGWGNLNVPSNLWTTVLLFLIVYQFEIKRKWASPLLQKKSSFRWHCNPSLHKWFVTLSTFSILLSSQFQCRSLCLVFVVPLLPKLKIWTRIWNSDAAFKNVLSSFTCFSWNSLEGHQVFMIDSSKRKLTVFNHKCTIWGPFSFRCGVSSFIYFFSGRVVALTSL